MTAFHGRVGDSRAPRTQYMRRTRASALGPWLRRCAVLALACGLAPQSALASAEAGAVLAPRLDSTFALGGGYQLETDVTGGDFTATRMDANGTLAFEIGERLSAVVRATYNGDMYRFHGFAPDPWDGVHVVRLNPLVDYRIDDEWAVFAGPLLEFAFENGADLGQSFRPGGLLGASFQPNNRLRIGFGVVGVRDIEDDMYIQPLLLLDWIASERIRVHLQSWTTRGGSLDVTFAALDWLDLGLHGSYRHERFRLDRREIVLYPSPTNPIVVSLPPSEGVGEDEAYRVGATASFLPPFDVWHEIFGDARIDLEAGVDVAGEMRVESSSGSTLSTTDYDSVSPYFGLRLVMELPDSLSRRASRRLLESPAY